MIRLLSILIITLVIDAFITHYQLTCIKTAYVDPNGMPVVSGEQNVCFFEKVKQ